MTSKSTLYANAVIDALHSTAQADGQPDINAALAACTYAQAYLLAKLTPQEGAAAHARCVNQLVAWTDDFRNGQEPEARDA